jgi:hypothetical protein
MKQVGRPGSFDSEIFLLNYPRIRVNRSLYFSTNFTSMTTCLTYYVLCCDRKTVPNIRSFLFRTPMCKFLRTSVYCCSEHLYIFITNPVKIIQFLQRKCVFRCRSEHLSKLFTHIRLFFDDRSEYPYFSNSEHPLLVS